MLSKGTVLAGRYEILERRGSGGYGTVYRARDRRRNRTVAVKVLREELADDPNYVRRFRREADIARMLDSRHVIRVFETGQDQVKGQDVHFQVMEYIDGPTLHEVLKRDGRLTVDEALTIAEHLTRALDEGEHRGVVHRDVKPKNIFIGADDLARLGDFGIARALDFPTLRPDDPILGTPRYMSPEQCKGAVEDVDHRSDIYSLGVVLYEMLAGRPPFEGDSPSAITYKQINLEPAPLRRVAPQVPTDLEGVVARCLAKSPEERYPTARALRQALESLGSTESEFGDTLGATPTREEYDDKTIVEKSDVTPSLSAARRGGPPRRTLLISLGGLFFGMALAGLVFGLMSTGGSDPVPSQTASATPSLTPGSTPSPTPSPTPPVFGSDLPDCDLPVDDHAPCIDEIKVDPSPPTNGEFILEVKASNNGALGRGNISISFPDGTAAELIDQVDNLHTPGSRVFKCAEFKEAVCRNSDPSGVSLTMTLIENDTVDWPHGQSRTMSVRVKPSPGDSAVRVLVRVAIQDGDLRNFPWREAADVKTDQQGFPAYEAIVRVQ